MRTRSGRPEIDGDYAAVIFGVEGVVVDSARASAAAWKAVFDPFLRALAVVREAPFRPFEIREDYLSHLYGRPRLEGVRAFLASRDIELPYDDQRGLAERQGELLLAEIRQHGVAPFTSTVALLRDLHRRGLRTAAVSARPYAADLLTRAGVSGMFDVRLDGLDGPGTTLPERSDPGLLLEAARRLGVTPGRTVVVQEAAAAVTAARRGGFGLIIGIDRDGGRTELHEHGADLVVTDLSELVVSRRPAA